VTESDRSPDPSAEGRHPEELAPLAVSTTWVVVGGITAWALALVVTLLVPALHEGDRDWWPWTCVAGIVLGVLGYTYVRRGRGNAAGAE
jgi:H+/Cl- antiporter ClcA